MILRKEYEFLKTWRNRMPLLTTVISCLNSFERTGISKIAGNRHLFIEKTGG
jgi:hypothetical protein